MKTETLIRLTVNNDQTHHCRRSPDAARLEKTRRARNKCVGRLARIKASGNYETVRSTVISEGKIYENTNNHLAYHCRRSADADKLQKNEARGRTA